MQLTLKDGGLWLSTTLEHIQEAVIGVDGAGCVTWMNPAAQRMTGWQQNQARGRRLDAVLKAAEGDPDFALEASVQRAITGGRVAHVPHRIFFPPENRAGRVDFTIAPVSTSGECKGAVIILSESPTGGDSGVAAHSAHTGEEKGDRLDRMGRVLVMDDDDVVRTLTVQKLVRLGYESEGASTGEEAVRMFKAARKSGEPFDVVVLDLIVRGGMGGKDTAKMLRSIDPDVKTVLTSGHAVDPVLSNFWEYGFFGVIRKPFVIRELEMTIRRAIEA